MCALLIAYASLYPFVPLRPPTAEAFAAIFRPRYFPARDIFLNTVAYVPFGALACLVFLRRASPKAAITKAALLGLAFSVAMEAGQLFIPFRAASLIDVGANAAGALLGGLAFAEPLHSLVTRPVGNWRERLVVAGAWGDAGLVLVALWLIAQLNPALPFFEAGIIGGEPDPTGTLRALQAAAVGLSVCGFGLFVSVVLKGPSGTLRFTILLLTIALWFKFVSASVLLKPHLTAEWVSEGRMLGMLAGIAMLVVVRRLGRFARTYLAALLVLAGALFSKIFGAYSPVDDFMQLFNWSHGQLASFATLTRYLHEIWPALALAFLVALFIARRRDPLE